LGVIENRLPNLVEALGCVTAGTTFPTRNDSRQIPFVELSCVDIRVACTAVGRSSMKHGCRMLVSISIAIRELP
jgi:hypothetical protein